MGRGRGGGIPRQDRRDLPLGPHRRPLGLRVPAPTGASSPRPRPRRTRASGGRRRSRWTARSTTRSCWTTPRRWVARFASRRAVRDRRAGGRPGDGPAPGRRRRRCEARWLRRRVGPRGHPAPRDGGRGRLPHLAPEHRDLGLLAERRMGGQRRRRRDAHPGHFSLGYGWIWFIPLGPTRTSHRPRSCPPSTTRPGRNGPRSSTRRPSRADPMIARLTRNAPARGQALSTTKDWSLRRRTAHRARTGFSRARARASPTRSSPPGMTPRPHGRAATSPTAILALERGDYDPTWLARVVRRRATARQIRPAHPVRRLLVHRQRRASPTSRTRRRSPPDAGLSLSPDEAWRWLGTGGFIERGRGTDVGLYGLFFTKRIIASFTGADARYEVVGKSHFRLDLEGAAQGLDRRAHERPHRPPEDVPA